MSFDVPSSLLDSLEREGIGYAENFSVRKRCSFKIGGVVALALFPADRDQLAECVRLLDAHGVKFEILGNASNLLFAFDLYRGAFIFTDKVSRSKRADDRIYCDAGVSLTHLANLAAANSLGGLEFAFGIPALVGGAVFMNAGAYGGQMSDVIDHTLAYDRKSGSVLEIRDNHFGYRHSIYMQNPDLICLGATFALSARPSEEIRAQMAANAASRREKQPLDLPSAGSYFKRPEGHFAGKLIEDCGLKGMRVGDAMVSPKHAGFIVNVGEATYSDVLELEEKIKEEVMRSFGVELEREVRLIADK